MSTADRGRRDPQPLGQGWELPVICIGGLLIGLTLTALAGMGAAAAMFGGGWVWPHGSPAMIHTLGGLLSGHPGQGLTVAQAARLPSPAAVYTAVGLAEVAVLCLVVAAGVIGRRHWRPGTSRGMATRAQAAQALGVAQLRAARTIIRPDRYPTRKGGDPQ